MTNPRAADWAALYASLARSRAALTREWQPDAAEAGPILVERARRLAAEPPGAGQAATLDILEFGLGTERYGLESRYIREVYPLKGLTPLPGVPAFVCGIVNLRGQIRSVLDLKVLFEIPTGPPARPEVILIHQGSMEFGLLADHIYGVQPLARTAIQPPPLTLTGVRQAYLIGVTAAQQIILDADKLLTDESLIVNR